jgi:hypothetical protein
MHMTQRLPHLVCAILLGAFALPGARAQTATDANGTVHTETSPGKASVVHKRTVVATVEAVDAAKGEVTLKGPKGNVFPVAVGPEVRNLAQVKVGDKVVVRYLEALALTLRKNGKELPAAKQSTDAVRTAPGARPGGAVADYVKVTADVVAVDRKSHLVRLKGPEQTVELYVADPEQLKLIEVGDQVEAEYTLAVALSVKAADAAKK